MLKQEGTQIKKILIGTTALLAAGAISSAAQASDPVKLQLGGFLEYWVAAADQDGDLGLPVNSFDVQGEGEIYFKGETVLDNGLTVGVMVQLEAGADNNEGDIVDESYFYVSGTYGKVMAGSLDNASYLMRATAPNAAYTEVDDTAIPAYLVNPGLTDNITDTDFDGDANKISYFTPKIYGLQLGVSYSGSNDSSGDDASAVSETIRKATDFDQTYAVGLSYERDLGPVGLLATAGYTISEGNGFTGDVQDWAFGLNLTYEGFTLGGAYRGISAGENTSASDKDGYAWDAGLMYEEGPYAVSVNYRKSSARGTSAAGKDEIDMYALGGKYALGPGVDLWAQLAYANYDAETGGTSNDGAIGGVVGLHLDF